MSMQSQALFSAILAIALSWSAASIPSALSAQPLKEPSSGEAVVPPRVNDELLAPPREGEESIPQQTPLNDAQAQTSDFQVEHIAVEGAKRTDVDWLLSFIGLNPPEVLSPSDLEAIRSKILSAGVFTDAQVTIEALPSRPGKELLRIKLEEQWTTIPVLRGSYGGGTPYTVFGAYDSHVFGRLWTLGAQGFRYGSSTPGYVIWAKAPQWLTGEYYLSFEFWQDRRRRDILDHKGERMDTIETDAQILRWQFLGPVFLFDFDLISRFMPYPFRLGLDFEIKRNKPPRLLELDDNLALKETDQFGLSNQTRTDVQILFLSLFDDIHRFITDKDGIRGVGYAGTLIEKGRPQRLLKGELFAYKLFPRWNFAFHLDGVESQVEAIENQQFLGGFDSVRGYPDGIQFGPRRAFMNVEARYIDLKFKPVWFQLVSFVDAGWAGEDWTKTEADHISSFGGGIRIIVPKINRFNIRIDFGRSLSDPRHLGISAGLNQFFQPYKPL